MYTCSYIYIFILYTLDIQSYLVSRCLNPQTSPENAVRGSKYLLTKYLEHFGYLGIYLYIYIYMPSLKLAKWPLKRYPSKRNVTFQLPFLFEVMLYFLRSNHGKIPSYHMFGRKKRPNKQIKVSFSIVAKQIQVSWKGGTKHLGSKMGSQLLQVSTAGPTLRFLLGNNLQP